MIICIRTDRQTDSRQFACVVLVGFLVFSPLRFQVDNRSPEALHTIQMQGVSTVSECGLSSPQPCLTPLLSVVLVSSFRRLVSSAHYKRGRGIYLRGRLLERGENISYKSVLHSTTFGFLYQCRLIQSVV
jgi:hypothetical protein